jgi:transcription-repair coupling factor (superfamily II helicase)
LDNPLELILEKAMEPAFSRGIARYLERPGRASVHASESVLPLLAALVYRLGGGPLLVAYAGEAGRLAEDIDSFLPGESYHLPGGALSGDWFRPYDEAVGRRLKAARALEKGKVAVAGVEALLGGMPYELPEPWPIEISAGSEFELQKMLQLLVDGGYRREYTVEGWGKFALRGGILDIFPSTAERPVRLELVGDRVESLREFNLVTQRSLDNLDRVELFPATAVQGDGACGKLEGLRVLAVNPDVVEARAREFCTEVGREPFPADQGLLEDWGTVLPVVTLGDARPRQVRLPGGPVKEFRGDLHAAVGEWKKLAADRTDVILLLDGKGQVDRARELWEEEGAGRRAPRMGVGSLSRGFAIPELKVALFTTADLVGRRERRRAARKVSSGSPVTNYAELEVGGYAVHVDQGIGVYRGLTSRHVLGVTREYLLLEYAGGDRLYVPTAQLEKVQRYVGSEAPAVHRLRGREWSQARRKARRSAERTARELLQLYLERKSREGFAFSTDTPWQRELEDSFEYVDTPDQARAVREVKIDMESKTAMDRLVCGDVGYGKTEVAIRAAMKAAMDSKQVAVLVPTTVLAKQHLETFKRRLAPFPVRVAMLSRFLSKKEQERVAQEARRGRVDVIIGTHRMLQEDIAFKDLGLLVVDEEQKFGVVHKERLRRLSRNVDTLTLTATPIPRTLQMSLSGVRDVSIIDTPPEDRHPIATYVGEFDMELVKSAVNYEVARNGQVFYVHNRIQSIKRVADALRAALPGVPIAVAHGRMDEDELEQVMLQFADGLYSVLVCTTIIESGLDLPNVNTLIVDRSDRLGLAQLYQIRGRVGRAMRRAYAYFFYPHRSVLTDTALARLATLTEMTPLGSGMRVAMRDLEIRGAGNLLGAEQSGHIEAVGFELYCQLLREAVDILKGEKPPPAREAAVELPVDAYIPEDYVSDQEARVELYRRLVVAGRAGALDEFATELEDRFGDVPATVGLMIETERMKYAAGGTGLESVTMRGDELMLKCYPGEEPELESISERAVGLKIVGSDGVYTDQASRTLYLKLSFEDEANRQSTLVNWLKKLIEHSA